MFEAAKFSSSSGPLHQIMVLIDKHGENKCLQLILDGLKRMKENVPNKHSATKALAHKKQSGLSRPYL